MNLVESQTGGRHVLGKDGVHTICGRWSGMFWRDVPLRSGANARALVTCGKCIQVLDRKIG